MDNGNAVVTTGGARAVEAGRGWAWWSEAWARFTSNAVLWVVLGLILLVIMFVLGVIPLLGTVVASLVAPVFIGGWMLAARKVETGGTLEVSDLFTCFKGDRLVPLLVLGALLLAMLVVTGLVAGVLGLGAFLGIVMGGANQSIGGVLTALGTGLLILLVVLVISVVFGMAFWFAPALVVFRGTPPVDAMRNSFAACLKNIVPFLFYGIVYFLAAIVASVPFGLGWIVLVPLSLLTIYTSYRDLYGS
ncbi:MAG: hypothetical protein HS128_05650 [Ideonella sp.]|nr:hypothetical protein [Ideonella sp.]MCC7458429.1 hypothetical protein [Nitrospira sp.]